MFYQRTLLARVALLYYQPRRDHPRAGGERSGEEQQPQPQPQQQQQQQQSRANRPLRPWSVWRRRGQEKPWRRRLLH